MIDKKMNLFFHQATFFMNIDRIAWQAKINLKIICYKKLQNWVFIVKFRYARG